MQIAVNKKLCPQNHRCPSIKVCPAGAIRQSGFSAPEIEHDKCIRCEKCVMYCPMGAIYAK